jgi:hypothetical protein
MRRAAHVLLQRACMHACMQVHVPDAGYAAAAGGGEVAVEATLDGAITFAAQGGSSGGWPLSFVSASAQLGTAPAGVCVRFMRANTPGELYMLPDPAGDATRTYVALCGDSAWSNATAPPPVLFGVLLEPAAAPVDAAATAAAPPTPEELAAAHNVTLGAACLLYVAPVPWALSAAQLDVPAPPAAAFDALAAAAVARRLRQSGTVTGELLVAGAAVASTPLAYDDSSTPVLSAVSPQTISAAAPEVRCCRRGCSHGHVCLARRSAQTL